MKEHPIIFSTPMVEAILAGRKTMTRRIVKGYKDSRPPRTTNVWFENWHGEEIKSPYGIHGDILWIREKWLNNNQMVGWPFHYYVGAEDIFTDKDNERWKPSIHMPKEAARIFLEVTNVRVERLHNISEVDIINEGVRVPCSENGIMFKLGEENGAWQFMPEQWRLDRHVENRGKEKYVHKDFDFLFAHWAELWCELNGIESWNENPWVWVIEFKVLSTTGRSDIKMNSEPNAQECDATEAS